MSYLDKLLDGAEVEWRPLGEIAMLFGGLKGKNKSDFENGNAKYVSYKNIFNNIEVDFEMLDDVNVSANENQYTIKYGDILFTGSSETADEAGMSSAVTKKFYECVYLNSFSFGLRFNPDICITPEFAKYLFRSEHMRKAIIKTASGVTRFNISKERFKKLLIPIPCPDNPKKSFEIQQNIVEILDRFKMLEAELEAELEARRKQYEYYRDNLLNFSKLNGGGI